MGDNFNQLILKSYLILKKLFRLISYTSEFYTGFTPINIKIDTMYNDLKKSLRIPNYVKNDFYDINEYLGYLVHLKKLYGLPHRTI